MNEVHANHPVNGSSAVWHFEINADIRVAVAFKGLKLVTQLMEVQRYGTLKLTLT